MKQDRRTFLKAAGVAAGALGMASIARGQPVTRNDPGLPKDWRAMRKFDAHNHVFGLAYRPNANWGEVENLIEAAEILGIEKLCCSRPVVGGALAEVEVVRESNDAVLAAMKRYPTRIAGQCFVQP